MPLRADKIALIGDLHGIWNRRDNDFFNEADYNLLLFVGDLGSGTLGNELSILRLISHLRVPGLVLPGNNDAQYLGPLAAELAYQSGADALRELAGIAPAVYLEPCGYSNHQLETEGGPVTLIAARPCAMGGSEFSFAAELERNYDVASLKDSTRRLKEQVDSAPTMALVFLGHNGPFGLGGQPGDLWARDFALPGGTESNPPLDWGDTDYQEAIDYARSRGKEILGVVGGHMHRTREVTPDALVGSETHQREGVREADQLAENPLSSRASHLSAEHQQEVSVSTTNPSFAARRDGILYVNPAVVPRIVTCGAREFHHFVELRLNPRAPDESQKFVAEERWVEL